MKGDLAANIHLGIYGKCDKANSPENSNADFQLGFAAGMESAPTSSVTELIPPEWERRGRPDIGTDEFEKFREWKRGLQAARMQKACAKA